MRDDVSNLALCTTPRAVASYRQPCVELAFYEGGKKLTTGHVWSDHIMDPGQCGNPKLQIAAPMCIDSENPTSFGQIYCHYHGERVKYTSAKAICAEQGREQGHVWQFKEPRGGPCAEGNRNGNFNSWANAVCEVQTKIDLTSGYVAIVNELAPDNSGTAAVGKVLDHVNPDTPYFFKSHWENGAHPSSLSECLALSSCRVHGDEYCICGTDVAENRVFSSSDEISSIDQLMSLLPVGAADPAVFEGTYADMGDCGIPGVAVHFKSGDCSALDADTVFAFEWNSREFYLKNSVSTVHIPGSNFSFRNPVHFANLADYEERVRS